MTIAPVSSQQANLGFTLIELSIVLVIIGLIAGGVLVGQDMIKAAEIRSQVAQINDYDQAFNAFRTKYSALPGDLANGADFGLTATGATGALGRADGNGLLQAYVTTATNIGAYRGEPAMAFTHLSESGLIKDGIAVATYAGGGLTISNTTMPPAKIGRGNRIFPTASNGVNYYFIGGFSGTISAVGIYATAPTQALTPSEAFQMDSKMDDGVPNAGLVRSVRILGTPASLDAAGEVAAGASGDSGAPTSGECWDNVLNIYATATTTTRDVVGCQLRVRTQF